MSAGDIDPEDFHTAVLVFAHFIGINLETEQHMLYVAEDALTAKGLPAGWELGIGDGDNKGIPYFFNTETGQSVWNHPREAFYQKKVKDEREKETSKKKPVKGAKPQAAKQPQQGTVKRMDTKEKEVEKVSGPDDVMEVVDFENDEDLSTDKSINKPNKGEKTGTEGGMKKSNFGLNESDFYKDDSADASKGPPSSTSTLNKPVSKPQKAPRHTGASGASYVAGPSKWSSASASSSAATKGKLAGVDKVTGPPVSGSGRAGAGAAGPTRTERPGSAQSGGSDRAERARKDAREREAREVDDRARRPSANMDRPLQRRDDGQRYRGLEDGPASRRIGMLEEDNNSLRDQLHRAESTLEIEREARRSSEDRLSRMQQDYDSKLKETVDRWEERVRKVRQEAEEEAKERIKQLEQRHVDDLEDARVQTKQYRQKYQDALSEADAARRRLVSSKDDSKLEVQSDLQILRDQLETAEIRSREQALEMRKLREQNIETGSKLASALQDSQVAQAEAEAAKAQSANVIAEGQSSHAALIQATNRIQTLDTEVSRLKSENLLCKREMEAKQAELVKMQDVTATGKDKVMNLEVENRRARATAEGEVKRLLTRTTELEAEADVMRAQLTSADDDKNKAVREVERELEKTLFEWNRTKERLKQSESKNIEHVDRLSKLEKELIQQQDLVFSRERQVKDEKERADRATSRQDELKRVFEKDVEQLKEQVMQAKLQLTEKERQHREDIGKIQQEVSEKLPQLSQAAAVQIESQFNQKLDREVNAVKARYDLQAERSRREVLDLSAQFSEREARQRAAVADDRAELERLKNANARLTRSNDDLEQQLEELQVALRKSGLHGTRLLVARAERERDAGQVQVDHEIDERSLQEMSAMRPHETSMQDQLGQGSVQAIAELQGQLSFMKSQLHFALESSVAPSVPSTAVGARRHSAPVTHGPESDEVRTNGLSVRVHSGGAGPRVTFSPESLFTSPDAKTIGESVRGTSRPTKSVFSNIAGSSIPKGASEDLDDSYRMPYSPGALNQSAIDRSYAHYGQQHPPLAGNQREDVLIDGDDFAFEGIQDGGFHEGYWKARYSRSSGA